MEQHLEDLITFAGSLTFSERKALVTLARSQVIPTRSDSPVLFEKVSPVLDKLAIEPPFESRSQLLHPISVPLFRLLHSPWTAGLLIVIALGTELTDDQVRDGKLQSLQKELSATQTPRRESTWNWERILDPIRNTGIVHPLFPHLSTLQFSFHKALPRLRQSYSGRIILPHYSNRGVSSQSAQFLLNRVRKGRIHRVAGNPRTFHRNLDVSNVTSKDIVHHYIRTDHWCFGKTEMKQRWYPSGILPRTYFSWSGTDIAVSCYLRNFFNDLGDLFESTHRRNRVQPDWLEAESNSHQGFLFYDLTSFTSWFHEQVPLLRSLSDVFRGVKVFLVGYDLTLSEHDVGDLIQSYLEYVNDLPEFFLRIKNGEEVEYRHQCAGFLGIPGNLITCTIGHGLAVAALHSSSRSLQVPGDDVGATYSSADHLRDHYTLASTLGELQFDKVFSTPGACLYLKRLVIDLGSRIRLAPMLVYPLLPYLIDPRSRDYTSNRFRLPDRKRIHSRTASVLVSFQRDLWKFTKGDIDSDSLEIILILLRRVHRMVGLPESAIFQGRVYGDEDQSDLHYPSIPVKFPIDDRVLSLNPDWYFANRFVTRMTIRDISEVEVSSIDGEVFRDDILFVHNSKGWRFLEDMGYVSIEGVPGEKIELVGSAARDAYLFASEPTLRRVKVLGDLRYDQLISASVVRQVEMAQYDSKDLPSSRGYDLNLQSWRYRRYVDLDDPRSAGLFGSSRNWVDNGLSSTRSSLSPEPEDNGLAY